MSSSVTLYAWAVPAFTSEAPVDHTWVTTYDSRVVSYADDQQVVTAGHFYWYCWGSFHPRGGTPTQGDGWLGEQVGDLALAQCLVTANADSRYVPAARGTVFAYGVDGVCHQLANQVLHASGSGHIPPLTVARARGYMASTFIYGTYGLRQTEWLNKIKSCSGGLPGPVVQPGGSPVPSLNDDFEKHARSVLEPHDTRLLSELLALHTEAQEGTKTALSGDALPSADVLNRRNQQFLDRAAQLLGPNKFKKVFGFEPHEKLDLVDPKILDHQ